MQIGIRKRLILSFILMIMVPVIVTSVSLAITFFKLEKVIGNSDPQHDPAAQVQGINAEIVKIIEQNYNQIQNYELVHQKLEPFISEYLLKIQVVNDQDILLYDSANRDASMKPADANVKEMAFEARSNSRPNFLHYHLPVVVEGKETALVFIEYNRAVAPFNVFYNTMIGMLISLALGFISLVLLIFLLTKYLSRILLKPLTELSKATERISQGDLDFNIHYQNNDEIGNFARSFESMRLQLKESLEKQQQADQTRKTMIASISHDLRTPISSIKGYVEGLQDGLAGDEETVKRYLQVIRNKTDQLNRQIEDLFQYSRLETGKLQFNIKEFNSQEILEYILEPIELSQKERTQDQSPSLEIQRPLISVTIKTDPQRLEQVMMNLLSNALRYVPSNGKITVSAFVESEQFLGVKIEDNGPGIPREDLPYVFDQFYRAEKSRSRELGGSGLGLSISKHIIEAHGGRIWVESTEGQGSKFFFTVPIVS